MTTWEDILGDLVGLADQFICATCMNRIFRGSTGHWGQRVTTNKIAPAGGIRDEDGKAITFQCMDCKDKEPILLPVIHPNGEIVNHIKIAELQDHEDKSVKSEVGDYDDTAEQRAISQQEPLPADTAQRIANQIDSLKQEIESDTNESPHQEDKQETYTS